MYGVLAATGGPSMIIHTLIAAGAFVAASTVAVVRKIRRAL
ncbi:MAG: hypothetical protein ABSE91_02350 [Patescibacteria group bacterium]